VPADEALRIGCCEHVVGDGESRSFAEAMAHEIARFPQTCVRADRRSAYMQQGLALRDAMRKEWYNGFPAFVADGAAGAARFAAGKGRHGDFSDI
jgi:enoyl-CoA hydratase